MNNNKIKEYLERIDLSSWLGQYTEVKTTDGPEIRLRDCPSCGKEGKFKVYVNTETKVWHCKHCNWGEGTGNILVLLTEVSGRSEQDILHEVSSGSLSDSNEKFLDKIYSSFNVSIKDKINEDLVFKEVNIPGNQSFTTAIGKRVREYAFNRGLLEDDLYKYNLNPCSKLNKILGPFLVFPIVYSGVSVGWQGRNITDDTAHRYVSCDSIGNFLWPIDTKFIELYNKEKFVVLVEGVFDALALHRYGIPGICTFGKKLSNKQILFLYNIGIKKIILCFDLDAGLEIEKTSNKLKTLFPMVHVADLNRNIPKSEFKIDPGEVLKHPELHIWLKESIDESISVYSNDFYTWKLKRRLSV